MVKKYLFYNVNILSSPLKQCAIETALKKTEVHLKSLEVFMPVVRLSLCAGSSVVSIVAFRFVVCCVSLFDLVFKVFALNVPVSLSPAVQHVVR